MCANNYQEQAKLEKHMEQHTPIEDSFTTEENVEQTHSILGLTQEVDETEDTIDLEKDVERTQEVDETEDTIDLEETIWKKIRSKTKNRM